MAGERIEEIRRIRRVSDQLSTGHAILRDRYAHKALALDLLILACSTWIVALAFVSPDYATRLTPFHWNSGLWMGTLSAATFFASIVQIKTDWKKPIRRAQENARFICGGEARGWLPSCVGSGR